MPSLRRTLVSMTALVVYLAGLVGGALHHHGHGEPAGLTDVAVCGEDPQASPAPADDDDDHDCAICLAVHQAQRQAPVLQFAVRTAPVGEAATPAASRLPLSRPTTTHARAPPAV